jgi:hypothetical protein
MYRVDAMPIAARALGDIPGMWRRARETLRGILETAEHARLIGAHVACDLPLHLRIGNYLLTYTIDAERCRATILALEPASSAGDPERSAG